MRRVLGFLLLLVALALVSKFLLVILLQMGWGLSLRLDPLFPSRPWLAWFLHGIILGTGGWWAWREAPKIGRREMALGVLLGWCVVMEMWYRIEHAPPDSENQIGAGGTNQSSMEAPSRAPRHCPTPEEQDLGKNLVAGPVKGLNFVRIPGGCFTMGSPDNEEGRMDDEGPTGQVCVSSFYMSVREVTTAQFEAFIQSVSDQQDLFPQYVDAADIPLLAPGRKHIAPDLLRSAQVEGCQVANSKPGDTLNYRDAMASWRMPGFAQTKNSPVVCVDHRQARLFIDWLNALVGAERYRLPTEAEWEYAARAGTHAVSYWGEDLSRACAYENVGDQTFDEYYFTYPIHHFPCRDDFIWTAPVGCFAPNPFGLYDMLGNVREWMDDAYAPYPETEGVRTNPVGPPQSRFLLVRGGMWASWPMITRLASRDVILQKSHLRDARIGFRVVMTDLQFHPYSGSN